MGWVVYFLASYYLTQIVRNWGREIKFHALVDQDTKLLQRAFGEDKI